MSGAAVRGVSAGESQVGTIRLVSRKVLALGVTVALALAGSVVAAPQSSAAASCRTVGTRFAPSNQGNGLRSR